MNTTVVTDRQTDRHTDRLTASFPGQPDKPAPERLNQSGF